MSGKTCIALLKTLMSNKLLLKNKQSSLVRLTHILPSKPTEDQFNEPRDQLNQLKLASYSTGAICNEQLDVLLNKVGSLMILFGLT